MTPYATVFRMPAVFVRHKGVKVYCTYKDDDINSGESDDMFTTDPHSGDPADGRDETADGRVPIFELDDLPQWSEPPHPEYCDTAHGGSTPEKEAAWAAWHKAYPGHARRAIRAAIDAGMLTQAGLRKPPKLAGVPILPPAPGEG